MATGDGGDARLALRRERDAQRGEGSRDQGGGDAEGDCRTARHRNQGGINKFIYIYLYIFIYIYIYVYICMYVYIYVCIYEKGDVTKEAEMLRETVAQRDTAIKVDYI